MAVANYGATAPLLEGEWKKSPIEGDCPICLDVRAEGMEHMSGQVAHTVCRECFQNLARTSLLPGGKLKCPLCRAVVAVDAGDPELAAIAAVRRAAVHVIVVGRPPEARWLPAKALGAIVVVATIAVGILKLAHAF